MSALSDYLHAHLPEGWTQRDLVVALAADLDRTTVYRYLNGKHTPSPPEGVLRAFARVLNVPIIDLRRAAGVAAGEAQPWVPPLEADRLNHAQRSALDAFLRATAAALDEAVQSSGKAVTPGGTPSLRDPGTRAYIEQVRRLGQHELADRLEATFAEASADSDAPCGSTGI